MANRDYDRDRERERDYERERRLMGERQPRPGPWRRWYNRPFYENEPDESVFDEEAWERDYNRPFYEGSGDWGRGTEGDERRRDYNRPYYRESMDYDREQDYDSPEWQREFNRPYYEHSRAYDYDQGRSNRQLWGRDDWDRRDWEQGDWARQNRQGGRRGPARSGFTQDRTRTYTTPGRQDYRRRDDYTRGQTSSDWDTGTGPYYTYTEYWWIVPGPYEGMGPKGYERSDERIREDICERLSEHGQIDPREVDINVENGEVTLSGSVDSRREKRIAEDIAETVTGVRDVHNRLRVEQQGSMGSRSSGERTMGSTTPSSSSRMGMSQGGQQIRTGMEVVGSDGEHIGKVKEIRGSDFLIDRELARDVYAPMSAGSVSGGQVRLHIRSDEVNDQGWPNPDILDTSGSSSQ